MKRLITFCIGLTFVFGINAQDKDPVLLEVGGNKVHLSEFEAIYKKNNKNDKVDRKDLEDYLELYINFKLKVKEAEELGMDTVVAFKKELAGYRAQLARPYLTDKNVTQDLIKEGYERLKQDVKASHILVNVAADALPKDTLKAYRKIMDIRKRILKGDDFGTIAAAMSDDPSAKKNKGELGYFSAFYMVYPFESAAYNTPVGEVSMPVRTRFGYHLIKVEDKRPARGQIRTAHIMIRTKKDATPEELKNAETKINEIYNELQNAEGEGAFEELAMKYSDDKGSARKGGELPVFGSGKMVPEFEEAAFALKNDGDYSKPFKTAYGWHIVKRLEKIDLGTFDEEEKMIKSKVQRDSRSDKSREAFIDRVKKEYGFKENARELKDFYKVVDNSFFRDRWSADKAKRLNNTMFTIGGKEFTQTDFASFLENHQSKGGKGDIIPTVDKLYNDFVNKAVIDFEDSKLEGKYRDFSLLMKEYRDGILLFELTDQKVWSKAIKDTVGLQEFYEKNKNNYMWDQRLHATIYKCKDEKIAKKVRKLVKKKAKKGYSVQDILDKVNGESQLNCAVESNKYLKGDNEIIDKVTWKEGVSDILEQNGQFNIVEVEKVLEPQPKELNEARGLITSDYQNYLEKEWIKSLKDKYPVKVNREVLDLIK